MSLEALGIDATNIRGGGGLTHIREFLNYASPEICKFKSVIIWGNSSTLNALEDRAWLIKRNPPALNKGLLKRVLWQKFSLSRLARHENCCVLFVPGGSYAGNFHPVVTMSQNLLPFELNELRRYGWTLFAVKLLLLRFTQLLSFKKADGVIFLTEYARKIVSNVTPKFNGKTSIIPHGINQRFFKEPRLQIDISKYDDKNPYRVLYVSIVDQYKHQWHAVKAIETLRQQGFPVVLDLVGSAYLPALQKLRAEMNHHSFVTYQGAVAFDDLHKIYARANLGLFASSCENMPNILLEKMASGLPIACSNKGPMPEILGDAGVYFNPEDPDDIANSLLILIKSPSLRADLARASYAKAQKYSWRRCANETFDFFHAVVNEYRRR